MPASVSGLGIIPWLQAQTEPLPRLPEGHPTFNPRPNSWPHPPCPHHKLAWHLSCGWRCRYLLPAHTPHPRPCLPADPTALPADKHPLPPALWPPLSKPLSSLTSQTATGASETGLPTAAFPPAVCPLHSQTTFASRISCQLWPRPSKGSSSHFERNPDSFYRAFQGRPCPPPQPPATRGSRTPDILAFCSSSDIGSSSTLSALPLCLSGMLFSWLPPGLYSNDTSSRRPSLTAPYTLKPIPTPIGLYPLHCFVFLQSTSQPLALHGPLPVVLSPARS